MKRSLLFVLLFTVSTSVFAQVTIDYLVFKIKIDATTPINYESEIDFRKCRSKSSITFKYEIEIPEDSNLAIARNATLQPLLRFDQEAVDSLKIATITKIYTGEITFNRNTENTFTILKDENKYKYKLKTKSVASWTTTFGANAVLSYDRSKFISAEKDGVNVVKEKKDSQMLSLMPAIMFTFINNQKDFALGFTGGLGTNFEEIAVYSGLSLGIGQNIILTGGLAVNKQITPSSNYTIGQQIPSTITTDNLNESQYRVNPFIGISFRLEKNPFVAKAN